MQFYGRRSTDGHGVILPTRTVGDVSAEPNELNEICISDRRLLIVQTGVGIATHLVSTESAIDRAKSACDRSAARDDEFGGRPADAGAGSGHDCYRRPMDVAHRWVLDRLGDREADAIMTPAVDRANRDP